MIPKVSIIVPVYNVEKYLDRCINSLVNQTLKEIEIILVDDESPDNCPEMCDNYAKKDSRIKVVHKKNGGLGFARNSGLDLATGEYFAFVDSDDYVDLDFYEKLYKAAKNGCYDLAQGGISKKHGDRIEHNYHPYAGQTFDEKGVKSILLPSVLGPDTYDKNSGDMSTCIGIYKLSLVKNNNIRFVSEREYISEDAIFDIEIFKHIKSAVILDTAGYYYCYNEASLTHKYIPNRFAQIKKLCDYELSLVDNDILKERIISTFLINVIATLKLEAMNYKKTGNKNDKLKVKQIVNDKYVKSILKDYAYKNQPLKKRMLYTLIDKGLWRSVLFITNLKLKSGNFS